MESIQSLSLSVASLSGKAIALGFGFKLVVDLYNMGEADQAAQNGFAVIENEQVIRAATFVQIPDGPLCVATAGDAKYISFYSLDSLSGSPQTMLQEKNPPEQVKTNITGTSRGTQITLPLYRYGPHTKRITLMATASDGCVVFANKFGEVYRLQLRYDSSSQRIEPVGGDDRTAASFLLQHLSFLSALYMSSPLLRARTSLAEHVARHEHRRIFTCDKYCRCRVSSYPEVYHIEQFLWPQSDKPKVITAIDEVLPLEKNDASDSTGSSAPAGGVATGAVPFSYYVLGNLEGEVVLWAARNDLQFDSSEDYFTLACTYRHKLPDSTVLETGAVVSVVYITEGSSASTASTNRGPSRLHGVLVAYEKLKEIIFLQLQDAKQGEDKGHLPVLLHGFSLPVEQFPLAMVRLDESSALILDRDGAIARIWLLAQENSSFPTSYTMSNNKHVPPGLPTWNMNFRMVWSFLPHAMPSFEEGVQNIISPRGTNLLKELDLFRDLRSSVVDPRTWKKPYSDDCSQKDDKEDDYCGSKDLNGRTKQDAAANKKPRVGNS